MRNAHLGAGSERGILHLTKIAHVDALAQVRALAQPGKRPDADIVFNHRLFHHGRQDFTTIADGGIFRNGVRPDGATFTDDGLAAQVCVRPDDRIPADASHPVRYKSTPGPRSSPPPACAHG